MQIDKSKEIVQINEMPMVRIFFEKMGRVKYTSHLDTMRTWTRALRRSGLPLWYTQGFNPHLYMTFALPIALGYESFCESLDLRFTKAVDYSEIEEAINKALPPGFKVTNAAEPVLSPTAIAWADYEVTLKYSEADIASLLRKFEAFMAQPVIETEKRSKRGINTVDIKPHIELLSTDVKADGFVLTLRMAAGTTLNIAPTLLLKEYYKWCDLNPDGVRVIRTAILTENLSPFC